MANDVLEVELRKQLSALLGGGEAHTTLQEAAAGLPFHLQGVKPDGLPYSPWQLLEHMRRAQHDILQFSDNADGSYQAKKWPEDYWPAEAVPPEEGAWQQCLHAIDADRAAFRELLEEGDLTTPFPWGDGQTLLREALLIADHDSYHTGELIVTRRLLKAWQPKKGHA